MIFSKYILEICLILQMFLENSKESSIVPEDIVPDLYSKYKEAVLDEKLNTSSRRLFRRNKQYEIHIKKLKEVNGFKKHNLMIKENIRTSDNSDNNNPFIYINNPVESKIPKSFLTLEEFKEVLTNRVKLQRNELMTKKALKIFNKTKIATSRIKNKNITVKSQSKSVSKKLDKITKLNSKKLKQTDATIVKNISFKYKTDVTTEKPTKRQTDKPIININSTIVKLNHSNTMVNVSKEYNTKEIESTIILMTTNKFKLRTKNIKFEPEEAKQDAINYLSTALNKSKIDTNTSEVASSNDDRTSIFSELLNENKFINDTEKLSNDTFTTIFNNKTEEESITHNLINVSPGISSNDYETMTTRETTNVVTEKTTLTKIEVSTFQATRKTAKPKRTMTQKVSTTRDSSNVVTEKTMLTEIEVSAIQATRKTAKPRRTTTQKVSFQVPRKRSTLSRPLVFMGSR